MSQSQPQPTQAGARISEKQAIAGGIVVSLFAVAVAVIAINKILNIIGDLVWLSVGLYVLGLFVQFWTAQSYRDGLTVKELTMAIIWPVDVIKTVRAGLDRQQVISSLRGTHLPSDQDNSTTLIDEKTALFGGIAATLVIGLPLTLYGIYSVLSIGFQLVWIAVLVYIVGFVVNFWISRSWKNGLTWGELTLNGLWPVDILRKIRAGVNRQNANQA